MKPRTDVGPGASEFAPNGETPGADVEAASSPVMSRDAGPDTPDREDTDLPSMDAACELEPSPLGAQGLDASLDDAGTPSIVTVKSACVGEPLLAPGEGDAAVDISECDAAGCGEQWRPCSAWDNEGDCGDEPGCRWELIEVINEGTVTGKRCQGAPISCDTWVGYCLDGCEETRNERGRRQCSGEPTPCQAFEHSMECGAQVGCDWN